MPIPDFQTLMLPLLQLLNDKQEHPSAEITATLADQFNITEEERKQTLSSGPQPLYYNRIAWAKAYLKRAQLIYQPKRGYYQITEEGISVLNKKPERIDIKYLKQFKGFDWTRTGEITNHSIQDDAIKEEVGKTPREYIDYGFREIKRNLEIDLLNLVKNCTPEFFERLVLDLLKKMGYGDSIENASETTPKSGDEGIDGIIKEDRLGLDSIHIQAKRWNETTVGRPEIQKFVGALQGKRSKKGVFLTTSDFSSEAREYVSNIESKVVLINGQELASLMVQYDVGVSKVEIYEIKKIDSDYFEEE